MTLWWHNDQVRLRSEKAAIESLETDSEWLENVGWSLDDTFRLTADFDIALDHGRFSLRITYHNTFPSTPPSIAPITDIKLSGHQYGAGGDLCLQYRPDNWRPEYTGAKMIQSTFDLLSEEAPDADGNVHAAPSEHNVPENLQLRNELLRFYLSLESKKMLELLSTADEKIEVSIHWCGNDFGLAQLKSIEQNGKYVPAPGIPIALGRDGYSLKGTILRIRRSIPQSDLKTIEDLKRHLESPDSLVEETGYFLLIDADSEVRLVSKNKVTGKLAHYQTILQPEEHDRSGEEYAILSEKRVAIVGLGSIGSKVAVSLARAGVGRFELIDSDILHAGNLERHDGDWRDIGLHKADAVARRIQLMRTGTKALAWRTAIGAQVSNSEAGNVDAALDRCDLVVDATANPDAFNHLCHLVQRANSSLVWGGVFAGGIGGDVGRSRPRKDASPFDIRDALAAFYAAAEEPPPIALGRGYDGQVNGEVWTATDADVAYISSVMAAIALDALIDREPSRYDAHAYVIGGERAWIFEAPFHIQPIRADAAIRTDYSAPKDNGVEKEFIDGLIEKKLDEIADRSKDN